MDEVHTSRPLNTKCWMLPTALAAAMTFATWAVSVSRATFSSMPANNMDPADSNIMHMHAMYACTSA